MNFNPKDEYGNLGYKTFPAAIEDAKTIIPKGTKIKLICVGDMDPLFLKSRGTLIGWYYGDKLSPKIDIIRELTL